jgi:hypothetical protein
MASNASGGRADIAKLVEKQMRNWEIARSQTAVPSPEEPGFTVHDFIAISRTYGSGGARIAAALGEKLQWPLFDREILQSMAGDDEVRQRLYAQMDERDTNWLEDALRWITRGEFRKGDYFYRLNETILALNRQGPAVFLGRGADLILPRDRGLRVRILASLTTRAAAVAQRNHISESAALAEIERIDRERAEFRRNHFGKDADDPALWDLTLSLDHFGDAHAIEVLLAAQRLRG